MSTNFWPDTNRIEHNGFTLDIAKAAIRNITYQGCQIIDLLYTAIRPWDWSTLDPDEHNEVIEKSADNCLITITDKYANKLLSITKLNLQAGGKFHISYELQAAVQYEINRWGVCFCLNTADWMGASVHSSKSDYTLLSEIEPQRVADGVIQGLFPAADEFHFVAKDQRSIRVKSIGKVLEAEDQRNWTDNTYKIYSGSLAEARPFKIESSNIWKQQVEFEVSAAGTTTIDPAQINVQEISALPRIGVQFNVDSILAQDELDRALTILDIDHLRINEESLTGQKIATTSKSGLLLEAALLSSNQGEDLHREIEHLSSRVPAGSRLLIQRDGRKLVEAKDLPANVSLNSYIPGSDAYLVDLHRDQLDFGNNVSYSMVPTVHSIDSESIFKTLYTQQESIEYVKKNIAPQVSISPITLSTRGNPETGHSRQQRINFANPAIALQIRGIEAAAWTLGSIFALASADAFSGTWHELFGDYGIIYSENGSTKFSPTFHALAALGAHHANEMTIATNHERSWIGFEDQQGRKMLVASLRPWNLEITAKVLTGYKTLQSLHREDCESASNIMDWWSYTEKTPVSAALPLTLTPFEIALLRG